VKYPFHLNMKLLKKQMKAGGNISFRNKRRTRSRSCILDKIKLCCKFRRPEQSWHIQHQQHILNYPLRKIVGYWWFSTCFSGIRNVADVIADLEQSLLKIGGWRLTNLDCRFGTQLQIIKYMLSKKQNTELKRWLFWLVKKIKPCSC
jgi:hypothetical protein